MLTYGDIEEWITSLFDILSYDFNIGTDYFSLLDVTMGLFGFGIVALVIKRFFVFYSSRRR